MVICKIPPIVGMTNYDLVQYIYVSTQIVNLAKQNEGWLRKMGDGSSRSRNRANRKTIQKTNKDAQTSLL